MKDAIGRSLSEDMHLPAQVVGQENRRREVAVHEPRHRHRGEDEPDAKQHLRELAGGVQARVEEPFENNASE
jgi:hypothetical protein